MAWTRKERWFLLERTCCTDLPLLSRTHTWFNCKTSHKKIPWLMSGRRKGNVVDFSLRRCWSKRCWTVFQSRFKTNSQSSTGSRQPHQRLLSPNSARSTGRILRRRRTHGFHKGNSLRPSLFHPPTTSFIPICGRQWPHRWGRIQMGQFTWKGRRCQVCGDS